MKSSSIRVRFAPAPTGMMHLGNVRTALMNYLFAKQKGGTFILRIEDTDTQRNYDPEAKEIIADLLWLGLAYDEGPLKGGPCEPYFQSLRDYLYKEKLAELFNSGHVYRCFCTTEELDKKRQRQIALKMPPRYDRTCLKLSEHEINQKLETKIPFVWRFKAPDEGTIEIKDLSHGSIKFDLKNFTDFPLTRQDETFTFLFANFVDDMVMHMSHVIRGEDHLSNTANQAMMYHAFNIPLPVFWHLPILCNIEGKKLSKRDFGFSLRDLKDAGFLPEALCNYLAIIGGSFKDEIMSLDQLKDTFNFNDMHSTGHIKYDVEKLKWINRKWIGHYDNSKLAELCLPYLLPIYPEAKSIDQKKLADLIGHVKTDLNTLKDITDALHFYFAAPKVTHEDIKGVISPENILIISNIVANSIEHIYEPAQFTQLLKTASKTHNISLKETFTFMRMALMGSSKGPGIDQLFEMLGAKEVEIRLKKII
jgi:nondiscriminating glutamyl-tRNA synthetase